MKRDCGLVSVILAICLAAVCCALPALGEGAPNGSRPQKTPATMPAGAEYLGRKLDPFYTKHVTAGGVLISSSQKVSDYAMKEAAYLLRRLLAKRPDVLKALIRRKVRVSVMAYNEMTTDIPECRGLGPWWDKRARGLGGNPVTCAEENLLAFRGDPYRGESILIHELGHIIHGAGLRDIDPSFEKRLGALYDKAKQTGRFRGYGMGNRDEFWAEGVQSWFNCNTGGLVVLKPDGSRLSLIDTRERLRAHLPEYARFLAETLGDNQWTYVPVLERLGEPHLKGYDPAKAPVFKWPKKVLEAFKRIEAERARRKKAGKKE